ncbi:hypothetical protein EGT29_05955 [Pigmentiphaga sp. H8]|uniref:hypothetical protein n=1 Tax=unclassified Pigmentiphaga TaxID=2626614 RepID=UPI000F5941B7|nr:hypothetical protein [Pigmentiphaga sp. H8]AZG07450.1 hypothetical protein EGT29_05955 [Pigmentiphaga sp. H8]
MKCSSSTRNTLLAVLLAAATPLAIAQTSSPNQTSQDARTDMGPSTGSSGKPLPAGQGKNSPQPESTKRTGPVEHGSRSDMGPSSGASGKPLPAGRGGSDAAQPSGDRTRPGGNDRDSRTDMGPSSGASGKPVPSPDNGSSSGGSMRR